MELDKLMESWNEEEHNFSHKEPTEIVDMLSKKSLSSMARIRRNMMFEFLFNIVFIPIVIILNTYLVEDKTLQGFNYIFIAALSCLVFTYTYKFRAVYKELGLEANTEKTLEHILNKLEIAIEVYKTVNYSIMPFAIVIGMINGGSIYLSLPVMLQHWPIYVASTIILFGAMVFVVEYSAKKMYGKHLAQLKENYNNLKNI